MELLKHQNIVKLYSVIQTEKIKECYLIMELCEGGSLANEIKENGKIPQMICLKYLKQILEEQICSNTEFIHRDIKAQNVLLTSCKDLKICDFGIAKKIAGDNINLVLDQTNKRGSPKNMAPEVFFSQEYSGKCDVWSIGILLYEMCTGNHPFGNGPIRIEVLLQMFKKIQSQACLKLQGNYHQFFKDIIKKTTTYKQDQRISIFELKSIIDQSYDQLSRQLGFKQPQIQHLLSRKCSKKAIKIVETTYKSPIRVQSFKEPPKESIPNNIQRTVSLMENDLELECESNKLLGYIWKYIDFLDKRSQLFLTIATFNRQEETSPMNKCQKYIVLSLAIGIYNQNINELASIFTLETIKLPKGIEINRSNLHLNVIKHFQKSQESILQRVQRYKTKYYRYISQLALKICSEEFQVNFKRTVIEFRHIVKQFKNFNQTGKFDKSRQWFQKWYTKFFHEYQCQKQYQCQKLDKIQDYSQEFLRIYWGCLILADVNKFFPIQNFQNSNIIDQFHDKYKNHSISQITQEVIEMRSKFIKEII